MTENSSITQSFFAVAVNRVLKPVARRVVYRSLEPGPKSRSVYAALFQADFFGREIYEWARRSLVATPVFLSQCAEYGSDIAVDRLPYLSGPCRIELGSKIRFGGQVDVLASPHGNPVLKIHDGVFIGHNTSFAVANHIEIGRYSSIGSESHIADTEGHSQYNPNRPIWEVPPGEDDIAEVVIEDNVQIGRCCQILKGVRIGARSVIGAGAVVRSNIPADSVVMGNPGRVVRRLSSPAEEQADGSKT